MKKKRSTPGDFRGDHTLEFALRGPEVDKMAKLADQEPSRLERYRRFFADYSLAHSNDPAGLNFENFVRNIVAAGFVRIGSQEVDVFFTNTTRFLVFLEVPDFILLKRLFPRINFQGMASVAESTSSSPITLIRVTKEELAKIILHSSSEDMVATELEYQRIRKLQTMLLRCEVEESGRELLRDIASKITASQELDDGSGGECYLITTSDSDEYIISTTITDHQAVICSFTYSDANYVISKAEV